MAIRSFGFWRKTAGAAQTATVLGLPFLTVNGESALRFDVPTLRLHFFGMSLWMDEFFLLLVGVIFLTALFLLVTLLFGRIWCGWVCPQTVLSDITCAVDRTRGKPVIRRVPALLFTLLLSAVIGASIVWYFVSPYEFLPRLVDGTLGPVTFWSWIVLSVLAFLNYAFLRQTWCATACPYAKLQGTLFDRSTLVIAFDESRKAECIDCRACVRTCPVTIDIRKGLNAACISCAACIDACTERMVHRGERSLVGYCFGEQGEKRRLLRPNVVMIGMLTLASLVLLFVLASSRGPAEMTVLPNIAFPARITDSGSMVNSYLISVSNRGSRALNFSLKASAADSHLTVAPQQISMLPGEEKKVPVFVTLRTEQPAHPPLQVTITLETTDSPHSVLTETVSFLRPEKR